MNKITADFYIKVNEQYNVVMVIGKTSIFMPEKISQEIHATGIKWYKDTYKPGYRLQKEGESG